MLRSLSILTIVFGHVGGFWIYPPWSEFLHVFVPIFFFISGIVSYNGFLKSQSIGQYLAKRSIGLLVPYYLLCFISLSLFILQNSRLPEFDIGNFLKWILLTPTNDIMPFPVGQVWFLHTLLCICLLSPLLFIVYKRNTLLFTAILSCSLAISAVQLKYDIAPFLCLAGHNFFKPLVHLIFFCLGIIIIDTPRLRSPSVSTALAIACLVASVLLVRAFKLNPDYAQHTYFPDFYYVAGSLCAIWVFLLAQPLLMRLYKLLPSPIHSGFNYVFRHTFAIYLLHSLAISFVEKQFNLVNPPHKTISYGITKFLLVLLVTLTVAPLFSKASSRVSNQLLLLVARREGRT